MAWKRGRVMKKLAGMAVAAVAVVGGVAIPASTASAANRVYLGCTSRTDLLRIFSNASTCWANAGSAYVRLYNVYEWCSGNNAGYLSTSWGIENFRKWTCYVLPAGDTLTVDEIVIYA